MHRVGNRSARLIKLPLKVGLNGPRQVVFCKKHGAGVVNMTELQDAITVVEEIVRLNSQGLAGKVARARLMTTKKRLGVLSSPLDNRGMCEAKVKRFGSNMTQYVQQSLKVRECEIKTRDLNFHRRVVDSLPMQQVLKSTHDADWSVLSQRLGNNLMVGDWVKCERGEMTGTITNILAHLLR